VNNRPRARPTRPVDRWRGFGSSKQGTARTVALPVLRPTGTRTRSVPLRRTIGRWRAAVLATITVLMVVHVLHWWLTGRSVGRFVLSDSTRAIEQGEINPGFLLFSASLLVTALFGRFMCGWICHMGALQDLCVWLLKKIGVRPRSFQSRFLGYVPLGLAGYLFVWPTLERTAVTPLLRWLGVASGQQVPGFPGFAGAMATERMWDGLPSLFVAVPFLLLCGFGTVFFLGARGLCRYGCPYGGFLLPAAQLAPIRVTVDAPRCDQCGVCTSVCTAGVRVHDQVRLLGAVADHNCIRSMDCVQACPQNALSLSFTPRLAPVEKDNQQLARKYDLTMREELLCAGVFLAVFLVSRGLYGLIPMLMAATLGILTAFLTWKTLRLFKESNVRLGPWQMRRNATLCAPGVLLLALAAVVTLAVAHSAAIRTVLALASREDDLVHTSFDSALAGRVDNPDERAHAQRARRLYALARPIGSGGLALASTPEADFRLAWMALVCGDTAAALDLLKSMATVDRTRDPASVQAARVMLALTHHDEAVRLLSATVEADPRAFESRELLANLWIGSGQAERAATMFREIVADRAKDSLAHASLGRALFAVGDRDEGITHLRTAAALAPQNADTRRDLAMALAAGGQTATALAELDSALPDVHPGRRQELAALRARIRVNAR